MLRFFAIVLFILLSALSAFGQAATGTITGTIADPAGAVVAGAAVEVRNAQGGAAFPTVSTSTGNYTVTQLPPGTYEVSVTVPGFKKYVHTNLTV
ncbi:MAG: carboxypeptidase regulatory-like domain-containing protein, partial [Acidobacteriia bacterium]|nr:carboxypeptidase regulatory-like domain-containing protein [Terriglobia bacterium]